MTIAHNIFGTGPEPVIVLHDWMSTHHSFDDVKPYLTADKFTYAFPDHRGYGMSRGLKGEHTVEEATRDVLDLADKLGWERFHLVGHSMSGMIAQRLSLDAPERLKSLALITPVTAAGMPLDDAGKQLFNGAITDDALWKTVANAVTGERLSARFYDRKLEQHRANVEPDAFADFLHMWTTTNFSADMKALKTPTLVIAGKHDFPAFSAENYKISIGTWYENIRVEVFENAGHYPMSETPPYFARIVEDFLGTYSTP